MWMIIGSVLGVFLVIAVGATCRRLGWLTLAADQSLAALVTQILLPMYFIDKMIGLDTGTGTESGVQQSISLVPVLVGFTTTSLGFAVSLVFARKLGPWFGLVDDSRQRAFALSAGICNYGYIPYPLAQQIYPSAMIDLIIHNVGVELSLWSIGILIISGGPNPKVKSAGTAETAVSTNVVAWKRILSSGPLLAVIVGGVLRASGASTWIPTPIAGAIEMLSLCAIPMGLLLGGAIMIDYAGDLLGKTDQPDSTSLFPVLVAAVSIRQCLMPVLMLSSAAALTSAFTSPFLSTSLIDVIKLQSAMPAAIFPIVLTRLYNQDVRTAITVVVGTSAAGVILIPVWMAIGVWWLG
jgi:predicted permease